MQPVTRRYEAADLDAVITARAFFESYGFKVVRSQIVALRGQRLTIFQMEKQLIAV